MLPLLITGLAGCEQEAPVAVRQAPGCSAEGKPLSIDETFHHLRACFESRSFLAMKPYLEPDRAPEAINHLLAMDELLVSNRAAIEAMMKAAPAADTELYDMSILADHLDLFSRDVEFTRSEVQGDQGVVLAKVSNKLPLKRLAFKRHGEYWVYEPGPTNEEFTAFLRKIAKAWQRLAEVVEHKKLQPGELDREYYIRVGRHLTAQADKPGISLQ